MGVKIDPLKCTACMACELACGYHRDDAFALLSSCIVVYRTRDKKDYFGVILKQEEDLVIARPEGLEVKRIGAVEEGGGGDASAKPMLLRELVFQGFGTGFDVLELNFPAHYLVQRNFVETQSTRGLHQIRPFNSQRIIATGVQFASG